MSPTRLPRLGSVACAEQEDANGFSSATVIGELLAKVAATLPAPETTLARGRGNAAAQPAEGAHAAPPPAVDGGHGDSAGKSD